MSHDDADDYELADRIAAALAAGRPGCAEYLAERADRETDPEEQS